MCQPPMMTQNQMKIDTEVHHHRHRVIIVITAVAAAVVIINRRIRIEKMQVAQVDRVAHHIGRPAIIITIIHHRANQSIRTKIKMMIK